MQMVLLIYGFKKAYIQGVKDHKTTPTDDFSLFSSLLPSINTSFSSSSINIHNPTHDDVNYP